MSTAEIFLFDRIRNFISALNNFCFPPVCCNCKEFVDTEGLCPECWKKIKWISDPKCRICGAPFETDANLLCLSCLRKKPHFDGAVAVFRYDDFSKNMLLKFKHGDATYMARQLAAWIYRAAETEIKKSDIIIPVPIHFLKRIKRKYNQSELLAMELSKLSGVLYEPRILRKIKSTVQQEGLSRKKRLKNVKGSFGVQAAYSHLLEGKKVILADDVMTTGATANECSKVLKKHGATEVTVLTVARVDFVA